MKELTSAERRALRARAHALHPVVIIGEAGLTPAVLKEIDVNLRSHELIKVRVPGGDRRQREQLVGEICRALDAGPVQHIGKILVIFRPRPEEDEKPAAPRRTTRKPPRKTKRSHQHQ